MIATYLPTSSFQKSIPYNWIAVTAIFLISPLLSLPFILVGVYRQKMSGFVLFSIFLGLLAWLQVPLGDLFRHTVEFYSLKGKTFDDVFLIDTDFISLVFKWVLVNNGFSFQCYRLFWVSESFFVLCLILRGVMSASERVYSPKDAFVRFIILFLFFEFIQTTAGVRYCCACYNFVFAIYLWFNRKKYFWSVLFVLLAIKMHTSLSFLIPMWLVIYLTLRNRRAGFIMLIIGIVVIGTLLALFGQELLGRRADFYFSGGNNIGGEIKSTVYGFILFIGMRVFLLPFIYIAYKYFNKNKPWVRTLFAWAIVLMVFITNEAMIFRIAVFISVVGVYALIETEAYKPISKKFVSIVLWCGIMTTIFNTVNYRMYILNSHYDRIVLPVPFILDYNYDKSWVLQNVRGNSMIHERQIF